MRLEFWHMCSCVERLILLNDFDADSQFSLYSIILFIDVSSASHYICNHFTLSLCVCYNIDTQRY